VQGAPPTVEGQIRGALADDLGSSLVTLDGDDVVRRLEGLPTVVSARYDRDFPHTLRLFVVPEQPVAVFRQGAESWLVSARGRVMARLDVGTFHQLPRIWVDPGTVMRLGALLGGPSSRTAGALSALPTSPFAGRVSTARTDGRTLTLVLRSGLELRLGRPAQLGLKFAAARAVLATTTRSARGAGSYLDLAVPERPIGHFNPQSEG
jgi:cell division protein FtsQ